MPQTTLPQGVMTAMAGSGVEGWAGGSEAFDFSNASSNANGCLGGSCASAPMGSNGMGNGVGNSTGAGSGGGLGLQSAGAGLLQGELGSQMLQGALQASGVSESMQGVAGAAALSYLGSSLGKVDSKVSTYTGSTLAMLRYYFDVNNEYVLAKLKVLLMPYRHADWERKATAAGVMAPPCLDVNAPDLYLPLMAFFSYILVVGFASVAGGKFTPEVLGLTASSGLGLLILEVLIVKIAFYTLQSPQVHFLDLCSASGYKFLGALCTLLTRTALGSMMGHVALLGTGANLGLFMAKNLRQALKQGKSAGFTPGFVTEGLSSPGRAEKFKKQQYTLFFLALLQLPFLWYLCRLPTSPTPK